MPIIINVRKNSRGTAAIIIDSNRAEHITKPIEVACVYETILRDRWVELKYQVQTVIEFECQRCMNNTSQALNLSNRVAICFSETDAERLMTDFEVVVNEAPTIDLERVIADELHLSAPIKHEDIDCKMGAI